MDFQFESDLWITGDLEYPIISVLKANTNIVTFHNMLSTIYTIHELVYSLSDSAVTAGFYIPLL